ncbi:MAG: nuclear transport factor 2 family protein, partial [Gammaproteobacteria bacterium]
MHQILKNSFLSIVLLGACVTVQADDASATKVVRDFLDSWHSFDIDKIMSFVSDDCHYENVPSLTGENPVIIGREKMREFLAPFFVKDPLVVPFKFHTEV